MMLQYLQSTRLNLRYWCLVICCLIWLIRSIEQRDVELKNTVTCLRFVSMRKVLKTSWKILMKTYWRWWVKFKLNLLCYVLTAISQPQHHQQAPCYHHHPPFAEGFINLHAAHVDTFNVIWWYLHPGRLTWNLQIIHSKGKGSSKPPWLCSMLIFRGVFNVFHVVGYWSFMMAPMQSSPWWRTCCPDGCHGLKLKLQVQELKYPWCNREVPGTDSKLWISIGASCWISFKNSMIRSWCSMYIYIYIKYTYVYIYIYGNLVFHWISF